VPPGRPRKTSPLRVALLVALGVLVFVVVLSVLSSAGLFGPGTVGLGDKIGILEVEGVIGDGSGYDARSREIIDTLRSWEKDDSIRGIVVRINSPGGTVGATQEIYQQIIDYKNTTKRPVVASMGDVAASGGFYTAMACEEIYANSGTLTGSIGVLLRFLNYQELTDKVGLQFNVVKSGQFKDIGSPSRPMTEEEKALLQGMVDNVQEQFESAVTQGREETIRNIIADQKQKPKSEVTDEELEAYVKQYADGRIFSGAQAFDLGMVDSIGTMQSAIDRVKTRAGIKGEPKLVFSHRPKGLLEMLSGETRTLLGQVTPGQVSIEYRFVLP
jgi:protease-4